MALVKFPGTKVCLALYVTSSYKHQFDMIKFQSMININVQLPDSQQAL